MALSQRRQHNSVPKKCHKSYSLASRLGESRVWV
jgi:hypothetical protein